MTEYLDCVRENPFDLESLVNQIFSYQFSALSFHFLTGDIGKESFPGMIAWILQRDRDARIRMRSNWGGQQLH